MADFILKLKNLIKLNLLHAANLSCYFQISSFVLSIGRVSENVVELHHRFFKCLDFQLLRLNHDEHLVEFLYQVIYLCVKI